VAELSQKRKHEDVEESPAKRTRMANRESNSEGSRKRKNEEKGESSPKRKRLGNGESDVDRSVKAKRAPSPQHQGRGRENTRVKEFPAGNVTTSASRIAFLQSLCRIPKFLSLVDLVLAVVRQYLYANIDYI
jgi:hypothetical protein